MFWAAVGLAAAVAFAALLAGRLRVFQRESAREIIVANQDAGSVTSYSAQASGNVPPTSVFPTSYTVAGLVRDRNGTLYVATDVSQSILVLEPDPTGGMRSIRAIVGPNTTLGRPMGLALDDAGNLFVANREQAGGYPSAVLKFGPGADGDVAPIAVIPAALGNPIPPSNTQLLQASGVAVNSTGRIYVVNSWGTPMLLIFAAGADGDVAPLEVITAGLTSPQQVVVAPDQSVCVSNRSPPSIVIFPPRPTSTSVPARVITSSALTAPFGVALDGLGWVYVADSEDQSVSVFSGGVTGLTLPIRKIKGPNTRLNGPLGLTLVTGISFAFPGGTARAIARRPRNRRT